MSSNQPLGKMIIELGLDSTNFASGMEGAKKQIKTSMTEMKAHLNIMGRSGNEVDKLKAKQTGLTSVIEAQNKKVQLAKEKYEACNETVKGNAKASQEQKDALIKAQNEYVKAIGELGSYENQLKEVTIKLNAMGKSTYQVGEALEKFGKKASNFGQGMESFGNSVSGIGSTMTKAVTLPLAAMTAWLIKNGIEVQKFRQQAGLFYESLYQDSKKAQEQLDNLMTFAKSTPYSYESIVKADKTMQTFGMSTERATKVLKSLTEAVAGTGGSADDLTSLATIMGQIESSGKVYTKDLKQLVSAGIPAFKIVANDLGISVAELQTELKKGAVTSDEAITALTNGLLNGTDGINGATVAYEGSLAKVKNTLPGAIDSFKSALKNQFSLELINDENFAKITQAINKFTEMLNSGAFDVLVKNVSNAIGGLVDNIIKAVEWFNNLSGSQQQLIMKFVGFAAVAGPVLTIVGKLTSGVGKLIKVTGNLTSGIGSALKKQALHTAEMNYNTAATTAQTAATTAQTSAENLNTTATGANAAATKVTTTATQGATVAAGANTTAVTTQKVATDAATASTISLKVALGALVAGVSAVVMLVSYFKSLGEEAEVAKNNIKEINDTYDESVTSAEASASAASKLVDELENLEVQGVNTNDEQRRYKAIVEELNTLMPDLNLELDEQTGLLKDGVTPALKDNIKYWKDYYKEQAKLKQYTDFLIKHGEASAKVEEAQAKIAATEAKEIPILKELSKLTGKSVEELDTLFNRTRAFNGYLENVPKDNARRVNELQSQLRILGNEYKKQEDIVIENTDAIKDYDAELATAEGATIGLTDATGELADASGEAAQSVYGDAQTISEAYEKLSENQKTALDGIVDAYKTMTGSLSNLNDEIKLDAETTWAKVQKNQADTIEKTQKFAELYAQLINAGVSESYLKAIGATGPEAIPLLEGMLNDSIDAVLEKQSEWEGAYDTILNGSLDSLNLSGEAKAAILEYVTGETGIKGALKEDIENADFESLVKQLIGDVDSGTATSIESLVEKTSNLYFNKFKTNSDSTTKQTWSFIGGNFTTGTSNVNKTVSGFKTKQESQFSMLKTSLTTTTDSTWTSIRSSFVSGIDFLNSQVSKLPSQLGSGLKKSGGAYKDGLVSMLETGAKGAAAPLNKVIDGANWILTKFGSNQKIAAWSPYAQGTGGHPGGNALVNDGRGAELVQLPTGETFIPQGKNVLIPNAPKGMKVLPAEETAQLMGRKTPTFHYANGIGDMLSNIFDSVKASASRVEDFALDIWQYIDAPGKLVDKVLERFVNYSGVSGIAKTIGSSMVSMSEKAMGTWTKNLFNESGGMSIASYIPSKGVEQWRSTVIRALQMEGLFSDANVARTLYQMQTESGGNPRAINLWDINAKRGIPSKGLMQVIDPTFKAYARPGYNSNIWDPLSNILASVRYAVSRYGSLAKAYRGVGYANGGLVTTEQVASIAEGNRAEMVIPLTNKSRAMSLINRALNYLGVGSSAETSSTGGTSDIADLIGQMLKQNEKMIALLQAIEQKDTVIRKKDITDVIDDELGLRAKREVRGLA